MGFKHLGIHGGRKFVVARSHQSRSTLAGACPALLMLILLGGCSRDRIPMLNPVGAVGEAEAELFYLSVGVMSAIIVPVILVTLWFAWRYRASSRNDAYDPKFSDSSAISKVTLLVPVLTIAVLGALNWVYTHRLDPYRPMPGNDAPYEIQVISLDYKWLFIYPEEGVATINELVAPTGRAVTLRMTSDPMMTAIFIPGLISQIYTMPGMETRANFLAEKPVARQGANAMYSGPGFEYQRFTARVVPPDEFQGWVQALKRGRGGSAKQAALLDWATFETLTPQSTDNPVTYYASVEPDLFAKAVRKYMPHYTMKPLPDRAQFDQGMQSASASAGTHDAPAMTAHAADRAHAPAPGAAGAEPVAETTATEGER